MLQGIGQRFAMQVIIELIAFTCVDGVAARNRLASPKGLYCLGITLGRRTRGGC